MNVNIIEKHSDVLESSLDIYFAKIQKLNDHM